MNLFIDTNQHKGNLINNGVDLSEFLICDHCVYDGKQCRSITNNSIHPTIHIQLCAAWRPTYELVY